MSVSKLTAAPAHVAGQALRVILYARVSTEMQAEEGKSIAAQLAEMREYAQRRGWTVVAEFVDPGYTGSDQDRPGLQALLAAVQQHSGDVVLVHELSRLSRNLFDTFDLFRRFGAAQVGFASVHDQDFDFSAPTGRLMLTIIAALNQYYVDLLKLHTKKSKRERAREGLYNSSIAPYGYEHTGDADTPPVIVDEQATVVRELFERYSTGTYSYLDLAEWLNDAGIRTPKGHPFSKDTLADMLRNPFYKGRIVYRQGQRDQDVGEEFPGLHAPIVTPELWEMCRQVREQRRSEPRTYQPKYRVYLLNGLVTCDVCGRKLRAQGAKAGDYYREVSNWRGFHDCPVAGRGAVMTLVDAQIGALFRQMRLPPDWQAELQQIVQDEDADMATLDNRRARLLQERQRLKQMKVQGEFDEDEELYNTEMARVQRQLAELPTAADWETLTTAAEIIEQLATLWDTAELAERRDLLRVALADIQVDVIQARLVALKPYPIFVPLFRQVRWLRESSFGIFTPIWPADAAPTLTTPARLPPLTRIPHPDHALVWPFIPALPELYQGARITPALSRWLKARSQAGAPLGPVVDLRHPSAPALQCDGRKWPGVMPLSLSSLETLPDGGAAFLWTPFAVQSPTTWPELLTTLRAKVAPGGTWAWVDWLPAAMAAHWLYQFFPEAWDYDVQHTRDMARLYNHVMQAGFTVTLERLTVYQPVTLEVAYLCAQQRAAIPALAHLPDAVYAARLKALGEHAAQEGGATLLGSEFCLVSGVAVRG